MKSEELERIEEKIERLKDARQRLLDEKRLFDEKRELYSAPRTSIGVLEVMSGEEVKRTILREHRLWTDYEATFKAYDSAKDAYLVALVAVRELLEEVYLEPHKVKL